MNANKLRGKIAERGMTVGAFCESVAINRSSFDRKMAGQHEFTRSEIKRIVDFLNLSPEETMSVFFAEEVTQ